MSLAKISIVMPVYNTGIYLDECLISVFQQTFQEFELICVDDCSKDELTKEILLKYQSEYSNFKVITLDKNIGAGAARNIGFSAVQSDYVIFLDADDVFAENMLLKMYEKITSENAEVCVCGYREFWVENGICVTSDKAIVPSLEKVQDIQSEDWFLKQIYAPWNKLCRREFLSKQNIYFQNISSSNDVFFSGMVLKKAKKICVCENDFVAYRINTDIQISANRNPCNVFSALELLENRLERSELVKKQLFTVKLQRGWWEVIKCENKEYQKQAYNLLYAICRKNEKIELENLKSIFLQKNILRHSFESNLFDRQISFLNQLTLCLDEIKRCLKEAEEVFLWGIGMRGNAFQVLCKKENLLLTGVTDIKNDAIGQETEHGFKIVHTNDVLHTCGVIVASNSKIQKILQEKLGDGPRIINLEEFCPWPEDD